MLDVDKILVNFPKTRLPLPKEFQNIFAKEYLDNREGNNFASSVAVTLEKWMHRQIAKEPAGFPLLEIGGGTLNHTRFEGETGDYDVIEPFADLYANSDMKTRISNFYNDIDQVPDDKKYIRIVSSAVLEHVLNLPEVIANSALLLEENGEFRAGIPTEGGLLWYLAWRFGTGLSFRLRHGLSYKVFMENEHVNNAKEIETIIKHFFGEVSVSRYPLPLFHGSFYSFINAKQPKKDIALKYIEGIKRNRNGSGEL